MRIKVTSVGVAALAITLALPAAASAQVQTSTEMQLAQRAAQFPHDISSLLDLAKLYFDQHRFEEAARTLQRAMAVIQQEQLLVVPTTNANTTTAFRAENTEPFRVGGDIKEPRKIRNVPPTYPEVALNARVEGYVILEALVGKDGRVQDVKVLKPHPLFEAAAIEAVRQWQYEPSTLNGVPIAVLMNVTVQFNLKK